MKNAFATAVMIASIHAAGPVHGATPDEIEKAARRAFPEVSWRADSVIAGDFTCQGRSEHAILGASSTEIVIAVFAPGQAKPAGSIRFSASARDPKSATLTKEDLDFEVAEHESEVGPLPEGLQPSKTCFGLSLSDGLVDAAHVFWNRKTRQFESWSL